MTKIYDKLLFDLDNTLVDDYENRRYAIKQILKERNGKANDDEIDRFIKLDDKYWSDRSKGLAKDPYEFKTLEEKTKWVRAQRFILYFKNISFEDAVKINEMYINYLTEHIVPIKNAKETLKYLYDKRYEIYIVTNGPSMAVNNKLFKIGGLEYIKGIFTAEEAGYMKPHEEFYRKFFEKLGEYDKDTMLMIGDEIEKDIKGAINNGIDSCWFNINNANNEEDYKPTYEIKDLIELKNIL